MKSMGALSVLQLLCANRRRSPQSSPQRRHGISDVAISREEEACGTTGSCRIKLDMVFGRLHGDCVNESVTRGIVFLPHLTRRLAAQHNKNERRRWRSSAADQRNQMNVRALLEKASLIYRAQDCGYFPNSRSTAAKSEPANTPRPRGLSSSGACAAP